MDRVNRALRRRVEDAHQSAQAAAIAALALGCASAFFLNHSSRATSTFWRFVITSVVNAVPKVDCAPNDAIVEGVAYSFTTICFGFAALYIWSCVYVLNPARSQVVAEEKEQRNLSCDFMNSQMRPAPSANPSSNLSTSASYYQRTPKMQNRASGGNASVRTPASGGGVSTRTPASGGGGARTPASGGVGRSFGSGAPTGVSSPMYTPKGYRPALNVPEEAAKPVSSPIVARFDQLANHPGSASERKRRRERLADQELLKSASKTQAGVENSMNYSSLIGIGMSSPNETAIVAHLTRSASSNWQMGAQSALAVNVTPNSRFSLLSPQLNQLFASPNPVERVRKLSDEEKRMKCKRWLARSVLVRVEDTINQYTRTKTELEHLKKHKENVKRVAKDEAERAFSRQKETAFEKCKTWSAIWQHLSLSGQNKKAKGFLEGGCKELFMFENADPDPLIVVHKVWEIYIDEECKKTQLYRDARVKCKSVKERFFNLERRFACYKKFLRESHIEYDASGDEDRLLQDAEWFRSKIEEESARVDAHMSEKSADPDKFWRFFECAMNDLVYKDESLSHSSFEDTGSGLFTLQKSKRFMCTDELRQKFESTSQPNFFGAMWNAAYEKFNMVNQKVSSVSTSTAAPFPSLSASSGASLFALGGTAKPSTSSAFATTPFGFSSTASVTNNSGDAASDLWPYYKLWLEHHWRKKIKQDMKKRNDLELLDENLRLFAGGHFSSVLVISQDDGQQTRSLNEGWPKFKIHICARLDKSFRRRLLDRIDIVSPLEGLKPETFHVKTVDDVVASISLFSEYLHEYLRIQPDDTLGDTLNIKSLRGIENFMYPH